MKESKLILASSAGREAHTPVDRTMHGLFIWQKRGKSAWSPRMDTELQRPTHSSLLAEGPWSLVIQRSLLQTQPGRNRDVFVCKCTCLCVYVYLCVCLWVYICVYMHVCAHVSLCMCVYICIILKRIFRTIAFFSVWESYNESCEIWVLYVDKGFVTKFCLPTFPTSSTSPQLSK